MPHGHGFDPFTLSVGPGARHGVHFAQDSHDLADARIRHVLLADRGLRRALGAQQIQSALGNRR